jgi:flagellum-specific peptidoglycan hydrolase FlgJ
MHRLNGLLLLVFLFVSCTSNKSVIQTTRKGDKTYSATSKNLGKNSKKSSAKKNSGTISNKKSTENNVSESQILSATTRVKVTNDMILAYIEKYKEVAQTNTEKYGIPASIILGQAILESGSGTGPLSLYANNHFGIKCHKNWVGQSVKYDDDSVDECFRKYDNPYDSFRDHAVFLTSGSRYGSLFKLDKKDYKAWANGLKNAGYATDSLYPTKLIGLIERFQLYKYDGGSVYTNTYKVVAQNDVFATNESFHIVTKGDTLYSISKAYKISIENLKKNNNLIDNAISIGQSIIIK